MDCGVPIVMWHLFDESGLDHAEADSYFHLSGDAKKIYRQIMILVAMIFQIQHFLCKRIGADHAK